jgi:signal transduction histidine kinase
VFRGHIHGVLSAFDRRGENPEFGPEDEDLMLGFAASAAAAGATARSVAEDRLRLSIESAEQERRRWARELHDDTLQGLAALRVMLGSALRQGSEEELRSGVTDAMDQIRGEVAKLRRLIAELRPAALDDVGLGAALDSLIDQIRAKDEIQIDAEVSLASDDGGPRLAQEVESTAYRIVQEALTNVGKHAGATRAEVSVVENGAHVEVSVRDDGAGFEPSAPRVGFGLTGMRERVALLGGSLVLESSPAGLGTLVRASLPARHRE